MDNNTRIAREMIARNLDSIKSPVSLQSKIVQAIKIHRDNITLLRHTAHQERMKHDEDYTRARESIKNLQGQIDRYNGIFEEFK